MSGSRWLIRKSMHFYFQFITSHLVSIQNFATYIRAEAILGLHDISLGPISAFLAVSESVAIVMQV